MGLLFGKPIGILIFSNIAVYLRLAELPEGLHWRHIVGVAILAGIGFTMALFISSLSLDVHHTVYAKTGILAGSTAAGFLGFLWLNFTMDRRKSP